MAETGCLWAQAVTIDDIVCVINSGRHKEKSYDPYTNVSTLQAQWISKASERQRRGRAGRCQQVCQHLRGQGYFCPVHASNPDSELTLPCTCQRAHSQTLPHQP